MRSEAPADTGAGIVNGMPKKPKLPHEVEMARRVWEDAQANPQNYHLESARAAYMNALDKYGIDEDGNPQDMLHDIAPAAVKTEHAAEPVTSPAPIADSLPADVLPTLASPPAAVIAETSASEMEEAAVSEDLGAAEAALARVSWPAALGASTLAYLAMLPAIACVLGSLFTFVLVAAFTSGFSEGGSSDDWVLGPSSGASSEPMDPWVLGAGIILTISLIAYSTIAVAAIARWLAFRWSGVRPRYWPLVGISFLAPVLFAITSAAPGLPEWTFLLGLPFSIAAMAWALVQFMPRQPGTTAD